MTTELKNALLVPQKATFEIQENLYVYVVDERNVVEMRMVAPKIRLPHMYILESGLTVDDRLVLEGIQHVKEGDLIDPQQVVQVESVMPVADSR